MQRREVLRILATGTALQFAPYKMFAVLREARTLIDNQTALRTLNSQQAAMVNTITEMILPRTETPGAADVGATAFIDLMLTEWYDAAERDRFLQGLSGVDSQTTALFGKKFLDCSAEQQADTLRALGEKMIEDAAQQTRVEHEFPTETNFYAMLRRLTLTAYYTSEAGATEELHFEIIPSRFSGCEPLAPGKAVREQK